MALSERQVDSLSPGAGNAKAALRVSHGLAGPLKSDLVATCLKYSVKGRRGGHCPGFGNPSTEREGRRIAHRL